MLIWQAHVSGGRGSVPAALLMPGEQFVVVVVRALRDAFAFSMVLCWGDPPARRNLPDIQSVMFAWVAMFGQQFVFVCSAF